MVFIKKHVKLFIVLTTIFIVSTWYIVERENDYFTHLNRVTKKFINEMEKEHGFDCFSIGGSFPDKIKAVDVKFYCYEKKSIEEARKLEIGCVEHFRKMINSSKKIRPYLEEFPFPSERVEVMICFCKKDLTNFLTEESISLVMNCREKLVYVMEFNDQRPNQTVLREPYSEAYEKVKRISSDAQQATLQSTYQSESSKNNKSLSQESNRSILCDTQQKALKREFKELERDFGFYKKAR